MSRQQLLENIDREVTRAKSLYPTFHSNHEGYAVIKEEIDELWDKIKASKSTKADSGMKAECVQIAAMAIRFIEDLHS